MFARGFKSKKKLTWCNDSNLVQVSSCTCYDKIFILHDKILYLQLAIHCTYGLNSELHSGINLIPLIELLKTT